MKTAEESIIKCNKSSIIKISITVYSDSVITTVLFNLDNINYITYTYKRTALNIIAAYTYLIINIINDYIHLFNKNVTDQGLLPGDLKGEVCEESITSPTAPLQACSYIYIGHILKQGFKILNSLNNKIALTILTI